MEFKKIALIGAGAVGAYFIYGFSELQGVDFCLVAEGERADRLRNDGVCINDKIYHPAVLNAGQAHGADLVLVCTKYDGLPEAIDLVEQIVDGHTTVMSLLNGIDSEELIAERIGSQHLLYSVMRISSERRNGQIHFVRETTIGVAVGEKGSPIISEREQAFIDLMHRANLKVIPMKDILLDQWSKYSMNIIYNLPQAILGVGFGAYYDSEYVAGIRDRMFEEVCWVAKAEGVALSQQGDWRSACVPAARFSTLQDLDAGRHTEVEMFAGTLVRLARKHGLEAPFCEFAYMAIKALEEKGDGRFEY